MEWEIAEEMLRDHIENRPDFVTGYYDIKNLVKAEAPADLFNNVNEGRLQEEFNDWLQHILEGQPVPKKIKSIYFGLFTGSHPEFQSGKELTMLYLCGSVLAPDEDEDDWACDPAFMPEGRYLPLSDFMVLDDNFESNGVKGEEVESFVFTGLLSLLVINSTVHAKHLYLKKHKKIYLGIGYDEGDAIVIGQLTESGIK